MKQKNNTFIKKIKNMMKKIIALAACSLLLLNANAQKSAIQSALNYLKDNEVAKAKKLIDEATVHGSTKGNAKAWLLKAVVYQAIGTQASDAMPQLQAIVNDNPILIDLADANKLQSNTSNAIATSLEAYKTAMSLDPKYAKDELNGLISNMVFMSFNKGIADMNASKYNEALTSFSEVSSFASLDNGKFFKGNTMMDTIFINAKMYQANSAYSLDKNDVALPLLEECIANPITQKPDVYIMALDIIEKQKNDAKWNEIMKSAKAKFPNEKRIITTEINYFLKQGKSEELVKKLKDGIAVDPEKVDLYVLLGQTYANMASAIGKEKPSNAKELEENAIAAYKKAEELEPANIFATTNLGMLFFNQVVEMTKVMNKADDKTFESMKPGREALINKSLPYLLKAKSLIEKGGTKDENKEMYRQVLLGLQQSYNVLGQADKATEMQNLLKAQ
jgi:predicted Zn-dependent protease